MSMDREYVQQLVALANGRLGSKMSRDELRELIDAAHLVWGVWQDQHEPHGVGVRLIKGDAYLKGIIARGEAEKAGANIHALPGRAAVTAFPCRCAEEAEALRQVFGEDRQA